MRLSCALRRALCALVACAPARRGRCGWRLLAACRRVPGAQHRAIKSPREVSRLFQAQAQREA